MVPKSEGWTHIIQFWRTNTENPNLRNEHERTSIFNCNKKQCVYCCSSELCVYSSDLGSLCSFFRLGFSVFVLQTWVPCVRSSGIGTMRSFLRFGFSVFVLMHGPQVWRMNTYNPILKNEYREPKSKEWTHGTNARRTNTWYPRLKNEHRKPFLDTIRKVWRSHRGMKWISGCQPTTVMLGLWLGNWRL
jgi:hypothetical protein